VSGEADVPVWLRVGTTRERVIGAVTINLTTDKDGVEQASVDGTALAGLLREAADEIEASENGTDS
jgi:hypothetical protein